VPKHKNSVKVLGPGKVPVIVTINGKQYHANIEPCITLLDAMREFWGLTGAKRVCDRATCGACTVLVNGKREYSCSLLAIDLQDDEITTIDHALTRPWTVLKSYTRLPRITWSENNCTEGNYNIAIGNEVYLLSGDGRLMPIKKDQAPPDLRYFKQQVKEPQH